MNNTGGYRNDRQDRADNRTQNTAPRGNYSHRNGQAAGQQRPAQGQQRPVQGQRPANRPPQPQQQRPSRPQQSGAPVQPRQPSEVRRNTASTSVAPAKRPGKVSKPKKPDSRAVAWVKHIFRLKDDEVVRVRYTEDSGYDYVFLVIVLVLLAFGTIMVYSASYAYSKWKYDDSYYIISRQFMFMAVGLVGMMFTMRLKPDTYRAGAIPLFLVCFFLLCIVPIPGIGRVHGGARRWLSIGFTEIQPSEFMKTGLVFMLAWYIDRYHKRITDLTYRGRASFFGVYVPLAITAVVCLLMVLEKTLRDRLRRLLRSRSRREPSEAPLCVSAAERLHIHHRLRRTRLRRRGDRNPAVPALFMARNLNRDESPGRLLTARRRRNRQ